MVISDRVADVVRYPVIEIFGPTIQGEGVLCGTPTHFLRMGGCGFRCSWCDTMYAVDPAQVKQNRTMLTADEIGARLASLGAIPFITISGGDPTMHKLFPVIQSIRKHFSDHVAIPSIAVETQGQFWPEWLYNVEVVTVSPKPPSSGMTDEYDWHLMKATIESMWRRVNLKFVIANDEDFNWVMENFHYVDPSSIFNQLPITFQPMTAQNDYAVEGLLKGLNALTVKCLEFPDLLTRPAGFKILPQMHRLMFSNQDRGV